MYKVLGKIRFRGPKEISKELKRKIVIKAAFFVLAVLLSRGGILGGISPFAGALIAAAPQGLSTIGLFGASVGYLLFSSVDEPLAYIAVCVAAAGIKWALSDLEKINGKPWFVPANALFSMTFTRILLAAFSGGAGSDTYALFAAEGILSAVAAFMFSVSFKLISDRPRFVPSDGMKLAACYTSCAVVLVSLSGMEIGRFSIGRALIIFAVMLAAHCRGTAEGAVAGITGAAVLSLAGDSMAYISIAYALGGLAAGVARQRGKAVLCAAFMCADLAAVLVYSGLNYIPVMMGEAVCASALFMILPKRWTGYLSSTVNSASKNGDGDCVRRLLSARLALSAKVFGDIGEVFESTAQKAGNIYCDDKNGIEAGVRKKVCGCCPARELCSEKDGYIGSFKTAEKNLLEKGELSASQLPPFFSEHCKRSERVALSFNRGHYEQLTRQSVKKRAADVRMAVSGQFAAMGEILSDINSEVAMLGAEQTEFAEKIEKELKNQSVMPREVVCRIMRGGRLTLEISGYSRFDCSHTGQIITETASRVTGKEFSQPVMSLRSGEFVYRGAQKAELNALFGIAQHSRNNSKFCGDSYNFFYDGTGGALLLLSDGMGTGGRAAVDSAIVCGLFSRMVTSGAGFESALNMVNSVLISRMDEESATTVDVCRVDLYSGKTSFFKAGAPYTYVRKKEGGGFLDLSSLPVGILDRVSFAQSTSMLSQGDIVVMMSDGAAELAAPFIEEELARHEGLPPQELAEVLLKKCLEVQEEGQEDDITVLILALSENRERPVQKNRKTA